MTLKRIQCFEQDRVHIIGRGLLVLIVGLAVATAISPTNQARAQEIVDQWRFRLQRPGPNWAQTEFDDSSWLEGSGGFGTPDTPNARVGNEWSASDIWLRKTYTLDAIPAKPGLWIHHDEDAQVFINGQLVADFEGFTSDYEAVPIDPDKIEALQAGKNVMAVHCHQTEGGQFIDVHLVDVDNLPKLPPARRSKAPFRSELITKWGEQVKPQNAWTEYPRPQMKRNKWQNLNGLWEYAVTPESQEVAPSEWDGKILVPFCLESRLGGVQRALDPTEALWYRRTFEIPMSEGNRALLNFEAVDYQCEVFVNGESVGTHQGGNTPFSLDITSAIRAGSNDLIVRVEDDTEEWQLRGKQVLRPHGIWYTQVSGIWQTVWLEQVPTTYVEDLKISTDAASGKIIVRPLISNRDTSTRVVVVVSDKDQKVAEVSSTDEVLEISIEDAKLWSPGSPHLYQLDIRLLDSKGNTVDQVDSYAGIRSVAKTRNAEGNWRFTLNGKPIFHWGTLDQGWWPDGLLTPPSDEGMAFDVQWLKDAGFNMIRKHIKVEPRRYYYHCDRLGMMLWQDQVSGGKGPPWTRLRRNPEDAHWPDDEHQQFMLELERMVDNLENHPSIVVWVPFNESWGQHRTVEVGDWIAKRDPSRLVNIASGGNFWPAGDVVDAHSYPHPDFPFSRRAGRRFNDYIKVVGEFGGHGYPVKDHLWDADRRNWGYGGLPENEQEYKERYVTSLNKLNELRHQGIAGGVYTQTTDVEGEINGLMSYDRKVIKLPAEELAKLHQELFTETVGEAVVFPIQKARTAETERVKTKAMGAAKIRAGLESRDKALYIKEGWIRDPYITLGPDDYYYLTGTQSNPTENREADETYNTGLGPQSIVGEYVRLWRSKDLLEWEYLGEPFSLKDTVYEEQLQTTDGRRVLWAPEVHWLGDRWVLVHCPGGVSSLALTEGSELKGPWTHPMGKSFGKRHDPSLFRDDDGTVYLLWQNTFIAPLSNDLTHYLAEQVRIDPAGSRPGPNGKPISHIGHEGATMIKVGGKYVHFGTAWSTDQLRKGSYNLYYCVADEIRGPYGPRKFAGRFLGHGTPFQTRDGKWWCTAFFNANVPPLSKESIQDRDLRENAQTINEQGVTIVPLDVRVLDKGDIYIRAIDPAYATPGPDEVQRFAEESPLS